MQLEWLARTGMFYPRLPDLTGQSVTTSPLPYQTLNRLYNEFRHVGTA
jgi:hypothetical protein